MTLKIKADKVTTIKNRVWDVLKNVKQSDMSKLGEFIANMIRRRTRLGYGVSENGQARERLKPLDIDYVQYREDSNERISKKTGKRLKTRTIEGASDSFSKFASAVGINSGKLNTSLTTVKKSNLTFSGRMLDSIKWIAQRLSVKLFIPDTSRPDSSATNAEVAKYVEENGRPFFKVSDSEIRQIKREAIKIIKESLKK